MKVLIFGTGKYYNNRRKVFYEINANDSIIGFIDNRADEIKEYDGMQVYDPEIISTIEFDAVILMSSAYREMRDQLLGLNVPKDKIYYWEEYLSLKSHGKLWVRTKNIIINGKKKILLLTADLGYHGGSMALVYAAKCLMMRGYAVTVAAPSADESFINEILDDGINVIIALSIPYIGNSDLFWISQFDIVIVNVFPMIQCACEINKIKPVLWWIHEASARYSSVYEDVRYRFPSYDNEQLMRRIEICAVSEIAKRNFERYYPKTIRKILSYGIPDEVSRGDQNRGRYHGFVFAIIGAVIQLKAQDIFLQAIQLLSKQSRMNVEFWIIGNYGNDTYGLSVQKLAESLPEVKMLGLLTRKRMRHIFPQIDVVVCPSLEDSMPIVVTEGMMYGKACIVSDEVGQAQFIIDGENGFVCKAGDAKSLASKMKQILEDKDRLEQIGRNGRQIYEEIFAMEAFGERLENALAETEEHYRLMPKEK